MSTLPQNSTIVLVHAAFFDASSWSSVIGPLLKTGVEVIYAQIPMTTLSNDVAALHVTLERADSGRSCWYLTPTPAASSLRFTVMTAFAALRM